MGGKSSKFEPQAPKTIVVFGATGSQGGSVVQAMRSDPNFNIKAVTRSKTGEKAQKLAEDGKFSGGAEGWGRYYDNRRSYCFTDLLNRCTLPHHPQVHNPIWS